MTPGEQPSRLIHVERPVSEAEADAMTDMWLAAHAAAARGRVTVLDQPARFTPMARWQRFRCQHRDAWWMPRWAR